MRLATFTVALVVSAAVVVSAQKQSRYSYLADAVERMIAASEAAADPTPASIEAIATTGCNALTRLLDDRLFLSDLDKLAKLPKAAQERSELKRDLALFVSSFMRVERKTLQDAGLSDKSSESLLWAVASMRSAADRDLTTKQVVEGISSLRTELCGAAREVQAARTAGERRKLITTWAFRVGGVLVVAANGAFASPSGGVALASVGIGSAIIGISFNQ